MFFVVDFVYVGWVWCSAEGLLSYVVCTGFFGVGGRMLALFVLGVVYWLAVGSVCGLLISFIFSC